MFAVRGGVDDGSSVRRTIDALLLRRQPLHTIPVRMFVCAFRVSAKFRLAGAPPGRECGGKQLRDGRRKEDGRFNQSEQPEYGGGGLFQWCECECTHTACTFVRVCMCVCACRCVWQQQCGARDSEYKSDWLHCSCRTLSRLDFRGRVASLLLSV